MLKTILVGSCSSVQGLLERKLPDGRLVVRVGNKLFTGFPVVHNTTAAPSDRVLDPA